MKPLFSLQHLENELIRYKEQKAALEQQNYPKDQEDDKQLLLKFYAEKIDELQALFDKEKTKVNKVASYTSG